MIHIHITIMDISKCIIVMLEVKSLNADASVCGEYVRMTEVKSSNADAMVLNEYIYVQALPTL